MKKKKQQKKPEPKQAKLMPQDTIRNLQSQVAYLHGLVGKLYAELNFANEVMQAKQAEVDGLKQQIEGNK